MKQGIVIKYILLIGSSLVLFSFIHYKWGFFGHRRINRLAVFTLPPQMMSLYKNSIEFLTEHAVDPDKRRYLVKDEAARHFIDLDRWQKNGKLDLPRRYEDALIYYCDFVPADEPINFLFGTKKIVIIGKETYVSNDSVEILLTKFRTLINKEILPILRKEDEVILNGSVINSYLSVSVADTDKAYKWVDTFTQHGILPYQLPQRYTQLVDAFKVKDKRQILRLSADLGHYIGDAHVPLHTTSNYNGQLTNQLGLHAFWESRIPELFADQEYDYFVGKAEYIKNIHTYIWDVVLKSHSYVDSVLLIEKRLSQTFPSDQQYCFDQTRDITIRTQCEAYAKAYSIAMKGMVEERMRESIKAVGSVWLSAWIDAGQPNLAKLMKDKSELNESQDQELNKAYNTNPILGRPEN